jgi:hypothetical protein
MNLYQKYHKIVNKKYLLKYLLFLKKKKNIKKNFNLKKNFLNIYQEKQI